MSAPNVEAIAVGRYLLCDVIGGGGMAQVHLGRMHGAAGFSRVVAVKRLHRPLAKDPAFTARLVDEARLVSRIRHPNVVAVLDVVEERGEVLVVMEYVHGLALSHLIRVAQARSERIPVSIAVGIAIDALSGLGAAHSAKSERGRELEIVHRDVSPQNLIVGADGITRVLDFGIAKAHGKLSVTAEGEVRGKLAYMAPEQLRSKPVDRRTDLYALAIVLWELVAGRRLFPRELADVPALLRNDATTEVLRVRKYADVPAALDDALARALAPEPDARFPTAESMADALEQSASPATRKEIAAYVADIGSMELARKRELVGAAEVLSGVHVVHAPDDQGALVTETIELEAIPPTERAAPATLPMATVVMGADRASHAAPKALLPRSRVVVAILALVLLTLLVVVAALISRERPRPRGRRRS